MELSAEILNMYCGMLKMIRIDPIIHYIYSEEISFLNSWPKVIAFHNLLLNNWLFVMKPSFKS